MEQEKNSNSDNEKLEKITSIIEKDDEDETTESGLDNLPVDQDQDKVVSTEESPFPDITPLLDKKRKKQEDGDQDYEDDQDEDIETEFRGSQKKKRSKAVRSKSTDKEGDKDAEEEEEEEDEEEEKEDVEIVKSIKKTKATPNTTSGRGRVKKEAKAKAPRKKVSIEEKFEEIDPKDAQNYTISELIKKNIIGQTMQSTIEREQQVRQHQQTLRQNQINKASQGIIDEPEDDNSAKVEFVNGKLVIQSQQGYSQNSQLPTDYAVLYESSTLMNNQSYSKRVTAKKWSEPDTKKFYIALRKYGTDFSIIESIFPDRTRSQLKQKYKREERENPSILEDILRGKINFDLEEFKQVSEKAKQAKRDKDEEEKKKLEDISKTAEELEQQEEEGGKANGVSKLNTAQSYQIDATQYQQQQLQQYYASEYQDDYYGNYGNDYMGDYD
ncbi:hypothetical protein CYY_006370 [Polysphondylium violaceum]|uniref:Myb-like domain-containing protein n=1 Tax=Polysphondylium violaceum TaxID=133409 RepID=A0A8J4UY88_9MYCE|nr:hypothetical protein CYY_006370 [Polysphondylium violaceum]